MIDTYIKNKLVENDFDSEQAREYLRQLKHNKELYEIFSEEDIKFRPSFCKTYREDWQTKHGISKAYPYAPRDFLYERKEDGSELLLHPL